MGRAFLRRCVGSGVVTLRGPGTRARGPAGGAGRRHAGSAGPCGPQAGGRPPDRPGGLSCAVCRGRGVTSKAPCLDRRWRSPALLALTFDLAQLHDSFGVYVVAEYIRRSGRTSTKGNRYRSGRCRRNASHLEFRPGGGRAALSAHVKVSVMPPGRSQITCDVWCVNLLPPIALATVLRQAA